MIRRQGYRFRLKPTHAEAALLRRFVGCARFVWNELLALNELRHECGEKRLGYSAMCAYLTGYLKDEYPFLREVHSQPLQQTLKGSIYLTHRMRSGMLRV